MSELNRELIRAELPQACRRAAKVLREHPERWMQRSLIRANQHGVYRACALGQTTAEVEELLGLRVRGTERRRLARVVGRQIALPMRGSMETFNDAYGRTAGEVADRLDWVADRLEFGDA